MAQVTWSPHAEAQLDAICDRLDRIVSGSGYAFSQEVGAIVASLPAQPYLGSAVEEYGREDVRERLCRDYRIIYRLSGDDVEVLSIYHASRRLPRTPPG